MMISQKNNLQQSQNINIKINPSKIFKDFIFWEEFKNGKFGFVMKLNEE
jgi:hypothetical protein